MRVVGISGALSKTSSNRALLQQARALAPSGMDLVVSEALGTLPLFNPDLELEQPLRVVLDFRDEVPKSDALFITCPEYGFSLPGALKNGIDWLIGSGELEKKLIATTALTAAPTRGLRGLEALHITLSAVSARIVGGAPIARQREAVPNVPPAEQPEVQKALHDLLEKLMAEHSARKSD
jgi:NAD(P)H-dependent FMN reductase